MMRVSPVRALEFKSALVEDSTLRSLALYQKSALVGISRERRGAWQLAGRTVM
jgi:hypothetical protein